jgi:hypothetical protein
VTPWRAHRDRRTAATAAIAAAAAKNIAKRSASCPHANPRLNKEISVITVSSRTLVSNLPSPLPAAHAIAADKGRDSAKAPVSMLLVKIDIPSLMLGPRKVLITLLDLFPQR